VDSKKKKIQEFARDLFLRVDDEGHKIHTWDSISKAILKKFKLDIHFTTIQKWSKKHDWSATFEKIKMAGIERGKQEFQRKEAQIIDEKADTIADIYKSNKQLQRLAQQTIIARMTGQKLKDKEGNEIKTDVGNTDVIRLIQHSENTLLTLHDKKPDKGDQIDLSGMTTEELILRHEAAKALEKKK